MKASDYIIDFLVKHKVGTAFLITGGAVAHVVDSIGKRKSEKKDIDFVVVQHEQAGAMAAEAYSRFQTETMGVMIATSGPGATNLITGICGCWFDSLPALFITGQVNTKESQASASGHPRQVGFQETDIVAMAESVTKYAVEVTDISKLRYELEKAWSIALSGRPGPVLVDIPVNLQVEMIEPDKMESYSEVAEDAKPLSQDLESASQLLKNSTRPVLLLGGGIKLSHAEQEAVSLVEKLNIPTVVSWSGFDILPHDHKLFAGHIGVYGSRAANFVVQNCDLLISIGSRLDTRQTGGRVETFARGAKKVMVDIDENEIKKGRGLKIDVGIVSDAKNFIQDFSSLAETKKDISAWKDKVDEWKKKYFKVSHEKKSEMNAYDFLDIMSDLLPEGQVTVADEGGNLVWAMQSLKVKKGQKVFSTFGNSPMGYALPAAIGAAVALKGQNIICIDGDGGFQMNIQELQTVLHYKLPIKIFIMNNRCMGIIKQFQDQYFGSNYVATTADGGYSTPDFRKVAEAYGLKTFVVSELSESKKVIEDTINYNGPVLVDVRIDYEQKLSPKLEFGRPIEDMSPYIDRTELKETMVVPILPESEKIPETRGWISIK